jgi:hypothetical protein
VIPFNKYCFVEPCVLSLKRVVVWVVFYRVVSFTMNLGN